VVEGARLESVYRGNSIEGSNPSLSAIIKSIPYRGRRAKSRCAVKIVIISDIHGNLEALTALPEKFDQLWVLGDLVNYGPNPAEVVDFIRAKASVVIRGNHDHAVGFNEDPRCSPHFREMAQAMQQYTSSVLSESQKQFLRDLPLEADRELRGMKVSMCHAVPSDPLFTYCPPDSPRWESELEISNADILLVGHTHLAFDRQCGKRRVVNPGSLGQPKTGTPAACYAVWEDGTIQLRSFDYPFEKTVRKIDALSIPAAIKASLAQVLRHGGLPDRAPPSQVFGEQ
jgi:putative phosphoesterase